jgi:hypothetical protein
VYDSPLLTKVLSYDPVIYQIYINDYKKNLSEIFLKNSKF